MRHKTLPTNLPQNFYSMILQKLRFPYACFSFYVFTFAVKAPLQILKVRLFTESSILTESLIVN